MWSFVFWLYFALSITLTTVSTAETASEENAEEILRGMNALRDCAKNLHKQNASEALPSTFAKAPKKSAEFIKTLSPDQMQIVFERVSEAIRQGCDQPDACISKNCVELYGEVILKIAEYEISAAEQGVTIGLDLATVPPEPVPPETVLPEPVPPEQLEVEPPAPKPVPASYGLALDNGKSVFDVLNEYRLCRPPAGGIYDAEAVRTALCFISKQSDDIKYDTITEASAMNRKGCGTWQNCQGDGEITCDSGYTAIVSTLGHWMTPCVE